MLPFDGTATVRCAAARPLQFFTATTLSVEANNPTGAVVDFRQYIRDTIDPNPTVACR